MRRRSKLAIATLIGAVVFVGGCKSDETGTAGPVTAKSGDSSKGVPSTSAATQPVAQPKR